jgi:hypothetical protein
MTVPKPSTPSNAALPSTRVNFFRAVNTLMVGFYGLVCVWDPKVYRFLDSVNLVFHEASALGGLRLSLEEERSAES